MYLIRTKLTTPLTYYLLYMHRKYIVYIHFLIHDFIVVISISCLGYKHSDFSLVIKDFKVVSNIFLGCILI